MLVHNRILVFFGILISCWSCTAAFFWGTSESSTKDPQPYPITAFYQQRFLQNPISQLPYSINGGESQVVPVQIPAIPIQTPLQARLAPVGNIQNVQLVPCLCPISQDSDYEKIQENGVYYNHIKNPTN